MATAIRTSGRTAAGGDWSVDPVGTGQAIESAPTVVGETLLVATVMGNLFGLSIDDGSESMHRENGSNINSDLTVAEGVLYHCTNNLTLVAVG